MFEAKISLFEIHSILCEPLLLRMITYHRLKNRSIFLLNDVSLQKAAYQSNGGQYYSLSNRASCNPTSPIEGLTDTSHHINRLLGIRYYAQNNYALGELNSLAVGSVTT